MPSYSGQTGATVVVLVVCDFDVVVRDLVVVCEVVVGVLDVVFVADLVRVLVFVVVRV